MEHYCKMCETELKNDEAVENMYNYDNDKTIVVYYCPNKECELFDFGIDERLFNED